MGKVAVAAMLAFGMGSFLSTLLGGVLGTQAEAAALGLAGLGMLGASRVSALTLKGTLATRAKAPA